jgi:hypothetical protein
VLEQMSEAGAAWPLVLRADVIPDGHMNDGRRVILRQDHLQPVRQRDQLVLELRRPDRGIERHQRRRQQPDQQREHADPG